MDLKARVDALPTGPGVYLFKGDKRRARVARESGSAGGERATGERVGERSTDKDLVPSRVLYIGKAQNLRVLLGNPKLLRHRGGSLPDAFRRWDQQEAQRHRAHRGRGVGWMFRLRLREDGYGSRVVGYGERVTDRAVPVARLP